MNINYNSIFNEFNSFEKKNCLPSSNIQLKGSINRQNAEKRHPYNALKRNPPSQRESENQEKPREEKYREREMIKMWANTKTLKGMIMMIQTYTAIYMKQKSEY